MRRRVAVIVLFFAYALFAWRAVGPAHLSALGSIAAGLALLACFGLIILKPISWWSNGKLGDFARKRPVAALSYLTMAFLSIFLGLLLFRDALWIFAKIAERLTHTVIVDEHLERLSAAAVPVLAILLTAWGHLGVRRGPRTVRVRVPISDLPEPFAGFKIVQLSDIHVGESVRRHHIERLVARVNQLGADLVAITGDLVDGPVTQLAHHVEPLRDLDSRHGTYFVPGNHDHYSGAGNWIRELKRIGFVVLVNEHREIARGGSTLSIAGVDDWSSTEDPAADVTEALQRAPADSVRILLAHHPKTALVTAGADIDLQLSGHTHGGQFLPWNFFARWVHRFSAGLYRVGKMWLYVSRGTFYWGPPVRLFAPAEITVLQLERAS